MQRIKKLLGGLFLCLLFSAASWAQDPVTQATAILERWTSFHWGRDCLVWIVHYPEELVDPWVDAEAARRGMSEAEKQEYREDFMKELRIRDTEAFLLTVYAFGPRPLSLAPFSGSIFLQNPGGSRVSPLSYEKKFDIPLSGIVQGLVFFQKQGDKDFSLVMKGLGVQTEQLFSFGPLREETPVAEIAPPEPEREVVVVELPPAPKKEPPKVKKTPPVQAPLPPEPPVVASPPELMDFKPEPSADMKPLKEELPAEKESDKKGVLFISKEKTVEKFVSLWIEGKYDGMYDLLSSSSRKSLTEKKFSSEIAATKLRSSLRDGYKIKWLEDGKVQIVTAQKMLLFRTLRSKVILLEKEDKLWKVTW